MKHFLAICMFLSSALIFAQNRIQVVDNTTRAPIAGAGIGIVDKKGETLTDEKGFFSPTALPRLQETDVLTVSHVSYETKLIPVAELKEYGYVIYLTEKSLPLREVSVMGQKQQTYRYIPYTKLTPMDTGLYAFASFLAQDKIYIVGGNLSMEDNPALKAMSISAKATSIEEADNFSKFLQRVGADGTWLSYSDKMYIYDIASDTWSVSAQKFNKRAYHNMHLHDGKLFILGGKRLSTNRRFEYLDETLEVYDVEKAQLHKDKTNPHQAVNFASVLFEDNIVVMGGSIKSRNDNEIATSKKYTVKTHLFDLKTGYWYEMYDMPQGKETKAIVLNNTIYLIGGYRTKALTEIESYNPATNKWTAEATLIHAAERPGITCDENYIYIYDDGKIQTYNVHTKSLNAYLIDLPLKNSEMHCSDGKLYIIGGKIEDEFSSIASPDIYSVEISELK